MRSPTSIQTRPRTLRSTFLLAVVLMPYSEGTVFADIAPRPLSGGANLASKGIITDVEMTDEVVKLRITRDACHVDVVFTMTNKGKEDETIPVGFPFFYADELGDFRAVVDGTKINVTNEKGGKVSKGSLDQPAGWQPFWKLWTTTFPPGKPVKIVVSYWTKLSYAPWGWNVDMQRASSMLTELVPTKERAALEKQLDTRHITYILQTGSRWAGPIGRCRIEASFEGISTDNLILYGPNFEQEQATITADKITWDLKDYEPKRDVEIRMTPNINRKQTIELLERLQKKNSQNAVLAAMLVEYLNAAGRKDEAEATLLRCLNECQDKVVLWGPQGKTGLTLEDSANVIRLVQQIAGTPTYPKGERIKDLGHLRGTLNTFEPKNPKALVPAMKRIAQSIKEQWKYAKRADSYYVDEADKILAWCEKQEQDVPEKPVTDRRLLKEAVGDRFKIGVGVGHQVLKQLEDAALIRQHFQILTPENCMKPQSIHPKEDQWNFEASDQFAEFARANKLDVVGHCLVWAKDDRTDEWMKQENGQPVSRETLLHRIETHIETVAGRYGDVVTMWDVVNEALADTGDNLLRDSVYSRATGIDFIVTAFKTARAKDPEALLSYNDYNDHKPEKREKLIRLLTELREKGAPVDAYGMQGHFELGENEIAQLRQTFDELRKLKIKVVVSELDIDVVTRGRWWADNGSHREELAKYDPYKEGLPPEIQQKQIEQYVQLFKLFEEYPDLIVRVSFWNLHDGQSWLNYFPWNRVNYPLLFDRDRKPKPAFDAVYETLRSSRSNGAKAAP